MAAGILQRLKRLLGRDEPGDDAGSPEEISESPESNEGSVVTVERQPSPEATDEPATEHDEVIEPDDSDAEQAAPDESGAESIGESGGKTEDETDNTNADETTGVASDAGVEEITGIGPTYAQRLQAAGIETVSDLADADPATVAEATNAAESRVDDWLAQARGD